MKIFKNDTANKGFACLSEPVRYSAVSDDCVLQAVRPWNKTQKYPLVVFVQGSGWKHPNIFPQLPQLCALARRGYVCASVVHRNAVVGNAFPACLEDVKCAIRYLRAHAAEYCIDTERVCVWGTSSGGNLAMLTAVTGDLDCYKTAEYSEQSDSVQLCISCFGPVNIHRLAKELRWDVSQDPTFVGLKGCRDVDTVMDEMTPTSYLKPGASYPPMLILGGDNDMVVPFSHAEEMYSALNALGSAAELIKVEGAEHEGSFWSELLLNEIWDFIDKRL